MADIWKEMCKQHGSEGMYAGNDDMTAHDLEVISSGSNVVDDAMGVWGLPRGRIIQYAGPESSGKTLMSLVAIAEYQKQNPKGWAMFIDAEYTFDKEWAAGLGVDLDRLYIYRENSGAKIFERLTGKPKKNKITGVITKAKPGILDLEKENPTGLGIIVLDSIASISPPAEEASVAGKQNMALLARFLPPEVRKLTPLLSETGVVFIAINQVRTDPGVMYGDPTTTPGGRTWRHHCSMMVMFGAIFKKDSKIFDENEEQIGHHIRVKVEKNKVAPPFRTAEIGMLFTQGIVEKNLEIRQIGAKYGIIERPNNKTWILDDVKYNGKEAMAEVLEDEDLQQSILERAKEVKKSYKINAAPLVPDSADETDEEE